ncbi:hypothetical protein ACF0H5_018934 [Mactra antiquata]
MSYSRQSLMCRCYGAMKKCFVFTSPFLLLIAGADKDGNLIQQKLHSICCMVGEGCKYLYDVISDTFSWGIQHVQDTGIFDCNGNLELRVIIASVVLGAYSLLLFSYVWKSRNIRARIRLKQDSCRASINDLKKNIIQVPSKRVEEILSCNFQELRRRLKKGEVTATEALAAFQQKALTENDRLNFLVEPVKEAEDLAKDCDQKTNRDRPLNGIPVSIKENYFMEGYHSTGGMSTLLKYGTVKEDGVLVKVLKHLGAVPFVRTNIPQLMMTFECSNPIYGCTVNPYNLKRGPGGSSGGEGAILGAEASILGWGSDIGGSLRIPSHFCGVYCLKPTAGRLGSKSNEELDEGLVQSLINPTPGPMARDVDTLVEAMKAVLCPFMFELDPEIPPIPFNTEVYESKKKLRIGYYYSDGYVTCIPGVKRGLDEALEGLKNRKHELVEFVVPDVRAMFSELFCKACFGDGSEHVMNMFNDDMVDPTITLIVLMHQFPKFIQKYLSYISTWVTNDRVTGEQMRAMLGVGSVTDWWELTGKVIEFRKSFLQKWKDLELDAVVCPTFPYVAPPTGAVKYLIGGVTYTTLYNVLNFPAGCVPVTKVTAVDQIAMQDYPSNMAVEKFIKKYFSADTGGLPVTVQCVGLPYQEEMVLRVMKEVELGVADLKQS